MSEFKHTPGPWWPSQNSVGAWDVLTYRDHDTAETCPYIGSDYGAMICSGIGDRTEQRTRGNEQANARLIATSPTLLDDAIEAEKMFRWYGDLHAAKPDPEKAARNYEMADRLAKTIAAATGATE